MASSVNKVILVGRLGKDPELKYTQGGTPVAKFSIATDETWKDQSGEKQQRTEWHNIVAWRARRNLWPYLNKGKLVYIEGKLQTRSWDDKEGHKRYTTEVVADNMVMLSGKGDDARHERSAAAAASSHVGDGNVDSQITDEDIPF
jgi:single-strand DNA-binding protein